MSGEAKGTTCTRCNDTHMVTLGEREVMCTSCPVPCANCRAGGRGAFCGSTPCRCECHRKPAPTVEGAGEGKRVVLVVDDSRSERAAIRKAIARIATPPPQPEPEPAAPSGPVCDCYADGGSCDECTPLAARTPEAAQVVKPAETPEELAALAVRLVNENANMTAALAAKDADLAAVRAERDAIWRGAERLLLAGQDAERELAKVREELRESAVTLSRQHRHQLEIANNLRAKLEEAVRENSALETRIAQDVEKEQIRWQERIHALKFVEDEDASGNESGDPLDFTVDCIRNAIENLNDQRDAAEERVEELRKMSERQDLTTHQRWEQMARILSAPAGESGKKK